MERIGGEDTGVPSSIRKVVVSSFIGTTIEWYDYFIYGTAAALVFPALFFPDFSELAGPCCRSPPSPSASRRGLWAASSSATPGQDRAQGDAGYNAPDHGRSDLPGRVPADLRSDRSLGSHPLVVLRLTQGLGLGGEWGGAVLMSVEHSHRNSGANGSWPQMGAPAGWCSRRASSPSQPSRATRSRSGGRVPFLLSVLS